jgi:hypothetical protein
LSTARRVILLLAPMRLACTVAYVLVPVAVATSACGDNYAALDAAIDAPDAGPPPGCDFGELNDTANGNPAMAEATGVGFSSTTKTICGAINRDHFNAQSFLVDLDIFAVEVTAPTTLLVTLSGPGIESIAEVDVFIVANNTVRANALVVGDHAITTAALTTGNYVIEVAAFHPNAIAADVSYKVKLVPDQPSARCTTATAAADYTEASDGTGMDNDMVEVRYMTQPMRALTAATTDSAEMSSITASAGMKFRITGTSADVNPSDEYHDRDSYLLTTGATTDQMSVRVNWATTTVGVDFDYLLFPATSITSGTIPEIASSTIIQTNGTIGEFNTFAVKPNTGYWLWVGSYDTPGIVLPADYDVTICGETFAP